MLSRCCAATGRNVIPLAQPCYVFVANEPGCWWPTSIHSGLDLHLYWEERRLIRQIPSGPTITPQSSLLGPHSTHPLRPRPNTCRSSQTRGVSSRSVVGRRGRSSDWVAYIDVSGVAAAGTALRRARLAGPAHEAPVRQAARNLVRCVHGSDPDG